MTDGDAENYEDYIIPLDQQLILDKLNMPLLTEQRANLNETLQPSLDSILVSAGKNFDRLADLQSTSNDHTLSDTLRDEVSPEESTQEATKYRRVQNLAETLVDDTQQDDADDDDFIDPSGGFELDVMRSTQTPSTQTTSTQITSPECAAHPSEGSVRRSKRNRVEETMPDESSPAAHMEASSSTHSSSPRKRTVTPSKAADDAYLTESSASKRRNLDTNWLTQPMTQDMQNELEDMDMDSHEDPVTQVSQALLSPSKSQGRVKDMRKIQNLGEKVAEDAQFDAAMIGRRIVKTFGRHGTFEGFVKHYCG